MSRTPPPIGSRLPPRDTDEAVRSSINKLADGLEALEENLEERLNRGSESFTRLDERVSQAEATARAANAAAVEAARARPIPWTRVVPIIVTVLVLAGAVVATMARNPGREEFDAKIERLERRLVELDGALDAAQRELVRLTGAVDALRAGLAEAKTELSRRDAGGVVRRAR